MKKNALLFIFIQCIVYSACNKFEYNVYELKRSENDIEITSQHNINLLQDLPNNDTLHMVIIGDLHNYYADMQDLVESVNALPDLDAVLITGDITNRGTEKEYAVINKQFKMLTVPFIIVIGNHDCYGNGTELHEDIYGPLNFSFTWNDIRFVVHNTNSQEFNFNGSVPDLNWMQQQLVDTSNYGSCIFISHVPPNNEDFDKTLEAGYVKLIHDAKNTIFSTNGHRHDYSLDQPYNDSIWYLSTSSPSNRVYCYVTVYPYVASNKKFDCSLVDF